MNSISHSCAGAIVGLVGFVPFAVAQPAMPEAKMPGMALPPACMASAHETGQSMQKMQPMMEDMMAGLQEPQKSFMAGMMATHEPMMMGIMAKDADVAFACGMIPHHQAAISMAEVELKYGDDQQMKEMAQKIIDAQKQEIAELTKWVEAQPK